MLSLYGYYQAEKAFSVWWLPYKDSMKPVVADKHHAIKYI